MENKWLKIGNNFRHILPGNVCKVLLWSILYHSKVFLNVWLSQAGTIKSSETNMISQLEAILNTISKNSGLTFDNLILMK